MTMSMFRGSGAAEDFRRAWQASEARLRSLIERNADGILVVRMDGSIAFANPAAHALLAGRPLIGSPFGLPVLPGETTEIDVVRPGGEGRVAEMRAAEIDWEGRPALLASLRDITERKRAEQERERLLRDVERRAAELDAVIASIPDAVLVGTAAGIEKCNEAARDLFGLDDCDDLGGPFDRVADRIRTRCAETGEPLPLEQEPFVRALAGEPCTREVLVRHRKTGEDLVVRCAAAPIRFEGKILGAVAIKTDITERKRLEEELQRRLQELAAHDRRKDEFLAMLAHELRNPLAPILNAVQIMQLRDDDPAVAARMRELIAQQAQTLSRLVDDLLDVSRITRGKIGLRKEAVDLADVLARSIETARPLIEARRHRLDLSLPDRPIRLEADPTRLEQVAVNLLNNAAKYTEPGGTIRLEAGREGEDAVIRVRDNGIGIAPEMLPRVFDLFAQADQSLDRSQGGLGIGLTLVRSLVQLHGGEVRAASDGPGRGSEFTVRLPALPSEPDAPEMRDGTGSGASGARGSRILVVDDNVYSAESLAMLVKLWGHEPRAAHDGPSALAEVASFRPQVVLLDIGLPGMDGYRVAEEIRRLPAHKPVLLVAMTGYGRDEDRQRSREAGFDHHLVKPVDLSALERLLAGVEPDGA